MYQDRRRSGAENGGDPVCSVPERIRSVLLVEDSDLESKLLMDRLADASFAKFSVLRVESLARAARALDEARFDIILLDLTLSDSSGAATLHAIRDLATATETPVVVITASADESLAHDAVRYGAQDYLTKGDFGTRTLVRTIHNAIERQRMLLELNSTRGRERFLATHDSLTELPNRFLFNDRLGQALAAKRLPQSSLAVLFLDVDRFKSINDTLGHAAGDQILRGMARRLRHCTRKEDTIARISGDEFAILLPSLAQPIDAAKVAENVREATKDPFYVSGKTLHVSTSIGIALHPNDGEDGETLVKNADKAMYCAKKEGGDGYFFYEPAMNNSSIRHMSLENELRRAIENNELSVHFQPAVDGRSGEIIQAEALLRWESAQFGNVPPDEFIPIAEQRGLISKLGEWVLRAACQHASRWLEAGLAPTRIAVNVSPRQLGHTNLYDFVCETLEETGLPSENLALEITESCLMRDTSAALDMLLDLKELGIKLCVDDFGTGYSSLSILRKLPVDYLKIDRVFVSEALQDPAAAQVTSAIIALAKNLGLEAVAEGVETLKQREFLLERHCPMMQGYLFAEPRPAEEFARLISSGRPLGIVEKASPPW